MKTLKRIWEVLKAVFLTLAIVGTLTALIILGAMFAYYVIVGVVILLIIGGLIAAVALVYALWFAAKADEHRDRTKGDDFA
jgi:uncharacterized membrane protein